jgi:tRNA1(Val) A37 N6-methylase TrmN6
VIALALLKRDPAATATLVELQPRLATLARRNAEDNALAARADVREADVATGVLEGAAYALAVSNPPYHAPASSPPSPDPESAVAEHELRLALPDVAREMRRALVPGARAAVVYPAERLTALLATLDQEGLRPLRLKLVHDRVDRPASRALVEARKGARGALVIEPPLVLRNAAGHYTREARRAMGDED